MKKMKAKRYQEGGATEDKKRRGLAASEGEKVGFFERMRMGNIDDPTSEAYRRFGAGRGASEDRLADFRKAEADAGRAADFRRLERESLAAADARRATPPAAPPAASAAAPPAARPVARPRSAAPSAPAGQRPFRGTQAEGEAGEAEARDFMGAGRTAARMRDERKDYTKKKDDESAKKQEGGLKKYARILDEGKARRAEARKNQVPARPSRAFSTPASRKAWDEKYGDKYEASGKPKAGMKAGGMVSASRRADGIAQRGKTRGKVC